MNANDLLVMQDLDVGKIYDEETSLQTITIELTNYCNWECKHCYLDNNTIEWLPLENIYYIIDEARELGVFNFRLSGGEVSMYPYLSNVISYARKKYLNVSLLSNMSVMSDDVYSCIGKYLLDSVEVTIFSIDDKVHDSFVGRQGALKKTLSNLDKIKNLGIDVGIKTWAVKSNISDLVRMKNYFSSLGYFFSVGVQIYSDVNGKMKLPVDERLSEEECCYALKLEDTRKSFPIEWRQNDRLCEDFSTSLYITCKGDIIPCAKYRKPYANIFCDSLSSVWEKSLELQTIQNYCWNDVPDCNGCKVKQFCNRCGAMSYIKGGHFLHNCRETCLLAKIRASNYQKIPKGELY